jgi:hypothetical protein
LRQAIPPWRVLARQLIAFGAQARDDALAVDERFRAAQRDKAYRRCGFGVFLNKIGHSGKELMAIGLNSNPIERTK